MDKEATGARRLREDSSSVLSTHTQECEASGIHVAQHILVIERGHTPPQSVCACHSVNLRDVSTERQMTGGRNRDNVVICISYDA